MGAPIPLVGRYLGAPAAGLLEYLPAPSVWRPTIPLVYWTWEGARMPEEPLRDVHGRTLEEARTEDAQRRFEGLQRRKRRLVLGALSSGYLLIVGDIVLFSA